MQFLSGLVAEFVHYFLPPDLNNDGLGPACFCAAALLWNTSLSSALARLTNRSLNELILSDMESSRRLVASSRRSWRLSLSSSLFSRRSNLAMAARSKSPCLDCTSMTLLRTLSTVLWVSMAAPIGDNSHKEAAPNTVVAAPMMTVVTASVTQYAFSFAMRVSQQIPLAILPFSLAYSSSFSSWFAWNTLVSCSMSRVLRLISLRC